MSGHPITRQTGEILAGDLRKRRFSQYKPKRSVRPAPSTANEGRHFQAPSGGIPPFNATTKQLGTASCREWDCAATGVLSDSGRNVPVYNPHLVAVPANAWIVAKENRAGLLVVIERPVPTQFDVRVKPDGTALQKSTDGGTTWTDFATIGSCNA